MGFSKVFNQKVPLNVPPVGKNNYTISFYTGGINVDHWANLTPTEQRAAMAKDWYIKWWYRHPDTGKMVRQSNIKAGINRLKTKTDRLEFMRVYKKGMVETFLEGFNPFTYKEPEPLETDTVLSAEKAILNALSIKKQVVGMSTYLDYKSHANAFIRFLKQNKKNTHDIKIIDRVDVSMFLDTVLRKTSPRNRNNVRASLSSIFSELRDKFIIDRNFVDTDIKKLKTKSKTDRRFTLDQMRTISDHLKKNDPHLLLYIKIVAYNFLRPIEVNRLTVSSIDLETQTMYFDQKTKTGKTKHIPNLYIEDFKKLLSGNPPSHFHLFTPDNAPALWTTADRDKRNYFSRRFKKLKDLLGLGPEYGLYSFRHTYITNTYLVLKSNGLTHIESIQYLMRITGHTSESGIKKYIHENDADRPADWSNLLDFKL
tara:strand:+ start:2231 stop:3508 length:1278 start_codon:yes stop_codon:yes gene_type:complete